MSTHDIYVSEPENESSAAPMKGAGAGTGGERE